MRGKLYNQFKDNLDLTAVSYPIYGLSFISDCVNNIYENSDFKLIHALWDDYTKTVHSVHFYKERKYLK